MATIVIADESAVRRRIITSVLEQADFDVISASDGLEAVQATFRSRPDAVLLAVELPRLSGYVVTRLLKDAWETEEIPVIVITSHDTMTDHYWGEQTGADGFLSKDFGAHELVAAVRQGLSAAGDKRRGRPPVAASPVELEEDDVLARVSELLDRKLFEAKVSADVTQIAADVRGFEETIAAVLHLMGRVVDYDLAAISMLDSRVTYLTVARESSTRHYREFCGSIADAATNVANQPIMLTDLVPRVADPKGFLGADEEDGMATFISLPLRAGGRMIGLLAVSSATPDAFGDAARDTLALIDHPVAVVISNAQLAESPAVAHVA